MKKYILLDIDGVFNSLGVIDFDNRTIISHPWGKWQIKNENIEFLKLLSTTKTKIYWISSWEEESNYINKFLKIKDFEYIPKEKVKDFVHKKLFKRNILIIDDELKIDNIKTINPNPRTGLDEEDRKSILKYIKNKLY